MFLTTKIFPTQFGYESTLASVPRYLEELGVDYVDLVLLHFPSVIGPLTSPCKKEGKSPEECRLETWRALSRLREKGLIRNAGVSNFAIKHIQGLQGGGLAPIANNQIQFHPFEPPHVQDTFDFCLQHNITITAYSPLGGLTGKNKAHANEVLQGLATKYGKSVSQIMLRWLLQRGAAVIPGTGNPQHMAENLSNYAFHILAEDMLVVNGLKHSAEGFTSLDMRAMA